MHFDHTLPMDTLSHYSFINTQFEGVRKVESLVSYHRNEWHFVTYGKTNSVSYKKGENHLVYEKYKNVLLGNCLPFKCIGLMISKD